MIVQWQILSSGGGYYEVIKAHCSVAWSEFRKLLPIKHIKVRGDAFSPCVRSAMFRTFSYFTLMTVSLSDDYVELNC